MGTVPASAVWTIVAKSPGDTLHCTSLVHGIEATTTTSPEHQKITTIEDQFASITVAQPHSKNQCVPICLKYVFARFGVQFRGVAIGAFGAIGALSPCIALPVFKPPRLLSTFAASTSNQTQHSRSDWTQSCSLNEIDVDSAAFSISSSLW
eukprot:9389-Heterococcus_DN1.PRE.1